jgi:hypothetical protein
MKSSVFRDTMICCLFKFNWRYGGTCLLNIKCSKANKEKTSMKLAAREQPYVPEDTILRNHRYESLGSHIRLKISGGGVSNVCGYLSGLWSLSDFFMQQDCKSVYFTL